MTMTIKMLKGRLSLLWLTLTAGVLLWTLGCGGANSRPLAPVSEDQMVQRMMQELGINPDSPSRLRGNGSLSIVTGSPVKAVISDPDGVVSVSVYSIVGEAYQRELFFFARKRQNTVEIPLRFYGQGVILIGMTDWNGAADSAWKVTQDGQVIRLRP